MSEQEEELQVRARLNPVAEHDVPTEDDVTVEERRNKVVARLRPVVQSARFRKTRRRRTIVMGTGLLAAAAALTVWFNTAPPTPETQATATNPPAPKTLMVHGAQAEITHDAGVTKVRAGHRGAFAKVEKVTTGDEGDARITVPAGVPKAGLDIRLSRNTEMLITRNSKTRGMELVTLTRGRLDLQVPKIESGTSFSVLTPSVRVVVVGTAFSVTVAPGKGKDSCVRVTEGIVRVESREAVPTEVAHLTPNDTWGCDEEKPKQAADPTSTQPAQTITTRSPTPKPSLSGTLGEETKLLARAIRAEQQKNHAVAKRALQKLLHDYPQSPLVDEARSLLKQISEPSSGISPETDR